MTSEQFLQPAPVAHRPAGRPRDPEIDERVLDAAVTELREHGYLAFRADAVSARSGVPKSTIYRRWRSLNDLAFDAINQMLAERTYRPTGNVRVDLDALVTAAHTLLDTPLGLSLVQLAAHQREEGANYHERIISPLRQAADEVARRAHAEGVIALDPAIAVDCVLGTLVYRRLVRDERPSVADSIALAHGLLGV